MIDIETGREREPESPERAEALAFRETFDVREHLATEAASEKERVEGILRVQKAQLAAAEEHIAALRRERDDLKKALAKRGPKLSAEEKESL